MKSIKFLKGMVLVALLIVFLSGCSKEPDIIVIENAARADNEKSLVAENGYKIYLITMDLADDFWKSIDLGCRKAVSELGGIDYKWIGPDVNEDLPHRQCIEQAIEEGADAILLAASSPRGVNESLEKAAQAGIKIVYVDNAAQFDCIAFLATDNELAGMIAGETMKTALIESRISSGTIVLMVNKDNVTSTALRVKGFRKVFEGSNFTLADTFFMEDEPERIKTFVKEHPDYVAFFGSNERTALALGEQIKDSQSAQIVVGFDSSDEVMALLYDGAIYATLQQKPQIMGYDGIRIAIESLKGNYKEKNAVIDTGVKIIYKDSIR